LVPPPARPRLAQAAPGPRLAPAREPRDALGDVAMLRVLCLDLLERERLSAGAPAASCAGASQQWNRVGGRDFVARHLAQPLHRERAAGLMKSRARSSVAPGVSSAAAARCSAIAFSRRPRAAASPLL
jgi:hypothetical protein